MKKEYGSKKGESVFYATANKKATKGSGVFSEKEKKQGFKVHTTSSELLKMDTNGYDVQKDFLLAKRREGSIGKERKVLRRSEVY